MAVIGTENLRGSLAGDGNNLPDGKIVSLFLRPGVPEETNFRPFPVIITSGDGAVHVTEISYFAKAIIELHAQRPQHGDLHAIMACIGS